MGISVREGFERCLEVGNGFDPVDFTGLDQRYDAALGGAALVMPREARVLEIEGQRADHVFHPVAVDLDPAIDQKGLQPLPMTVDVGKFLAEPGLSGYPAELRLKPVSEGRHQWWTAGPDERRGDGLRKCRGYRPRPHKARRSGAVLRRRCPSRRGRRPPSARPAPARGLGRPIVAGIAIDLQDAVEARQEGFGTRGSAVSATPFSTQLSLIVIPKRRFGRRESSSRHSTTSNPAAWLDLMPMGVNR